MTIVIFVVVVHTECLHYFKRKCWRQEAIVSTPLSEYDIDQCHSLSPFFLTGPELDYNAVSRQNCCWH